MPDPQQLTEVFAQVSLWAMLLASVLGLLPRLTPSTFALVPVIVGYVGASARSSPVAWGGALAFLGGLTLVKAGGAAAPGALA